MAEKQPPHLNAVAATPASDDNYFESGPNGCIVSVDPSIAGGVTVEIKTLQGTSTYNSIKDSSDTIDSTRKILNSSNTSRVISAGFKGSIETDGAAVVYITRV